MAIEEGLYSYLSTKASVIAITGTRGYPVTIPEDAALPAWAYQAIPSSPRVFQAHDGHAGLAHGRYQFTCQAATYSAAKSLANAIRGALVGFRGTMGSTQVDGCQVYGDLDGYGLSTAVMTVRFDAEFWYRE